MYGFFFDAYLQKNKFRKMVNEIENKLADLGIKDKIIKYYKILNICLNLFFFLINFIGMLNNRHISKGWHI